jgi:hypothetical protein
MDACQRRSSFPQRFQNFRRCQGAPAAHGARLAFTAGRELKRCGDFSNGYATGACTNPNLKQSFNIGQGFDYYYDDFISYNFSSSHTKRSLLRNLVQVSKFQAALFKEIECLNREISGAAMCKRMRSECAG